MSASRFTQAEQKVLLGLHPDLQSVLRQFAREYELPFRLLEGRRTLQRQRILFQRGATKTMNSRHLTGHAFDLAPMVGRAVSWHWPHYYPLALEMKRAAKIVGVPLVWGGDWSTFKDGPHWELPWSSHPIKGN